MPHITIKMLKGRTDEQKQLAAQKVSDALCEAIGVADEHVSVDVKEYTKLEWQDVFADEVTENKFLVKKPNYDPRDMLK